MDTESLPRFLTIYEVANLVRLAPCEVKAAIRQGDLEAHILSGEIRITRAAVDRWLSLSRSPGRQRRRAER